MNKFSSFKHQQRLFENWRSFCEDNNIQQEEGYLLVESGPLHSREKRNFNSLLEEVIDGSLNHDDFLEMWQESVNCEMKKVESILLEEGIAEITQKVIAKAIPAIMNMMANALQYIQKFLQKLNDMSIMAFIKGQQVVAGILKKAAAIAKKVEPYVGPTFKIMAVVGIFFVLFGSMGALAGQGGVDAINTMDPDHAKLLKASLKLAHDCQELAGGADTYEPDLAQQVMARVVDSSTSGGKDVDFQQVMVFLKGDSMTNNCVRAAENIQQTLTNGVPLDGIGESSAVKATIGDLIKNAEVLKDLDPEAFNKAAEIGDKLEVLNSTVIDSATDLVHARSKVSTGGQVNVDFSSKLNSVMNTISKKFIHIKGEKMPDMLDIAGNPIELPKNAITHALEKSPDLLSKGTEQEIAKAVIQSAKELGQETGKVVTRTNDSFWDKLVKQLS